MRAARPTARRSILLKPRAVREGSRVSAVEDLVPTLEAAFADGGVHLVEVPIDYSENTRVLVDELRNRTPDVECA